MDGDRAWLRLPCLALPVSAGIVWGRLHVTKRLVLRVCLQQDSRWLWKHTTRTAMINEHLNHLNRRQSLYSGGSIMPYHAMPCHVARREGVRACVRGQDKHEKRRSGDLPIVAPPSPLSPAGEAMRPWTNVSSSTSGPEVNEACTASDNSQPGARQARRERLLYETSPLFSYGTLEVSLARLSHAAAALPGTGTGSVTGPASPLTSSLSLLMPIR